jgi:hypothetical protein
LGPVYFSRYYTLVSREIQLAANHGGRGMSQVEMYFNHHAFGFWLGLLIALLAFAAWAIWTSVRSSRLLARYESTVREVEGGNVPAMLTNYLATVQGIAAQSDEMARRVDHLYESLPSLVRHVGLVRFSPFHDTGGDQSFSLALLDGKGDGVVVSALHSRQDHKLYAKPVSGRTSHYQLTDEERRAIDESARVEVEAAPA